MIILRIFFIELIYIKQKYHIILLIVKSEYLIHTVAIVLVGVFTKGDKFVILTKKTDGGMTDSIEGAGLHRGVMEHVLEDDGLTYLQLVIETPC